MRELIKVFKSSATVKQFARFWESHGDELRLGGREALLDLVSDPGADLPKNELAMYKKGQADIIELFLNSWIQSQEPDGSGLPDEVDPTH